MKQTEGYRDECRERWQAIWNSPVNAEIKEADRRIHTLWKDPACKVDSSIRDTATTLAGRLRLHLYPSVQLLAALKALELVMSEAQSAEYMDRQQDNMDSFERWVDSLKAQDSEAK
jgi:hypothetical protein